MAQRCFARRFGIDWCLCLVSRRFLLLRVTGVRSQTSRSKHSGVDGGRRRLESDPVQCAPVPGLGRWGERIRFMVGSTYLGVVATAGAHAMEKPGSDKALSATVVYVSLLAGPADRDCPRDFHHICYLGHLWTPVAGMGHFEGCK